MNIAERLSQNAKLHPDKLAVKFPKFNKKTKKYDYEALTFRELDIRSNKFATSLQKMGLKKGDRTLLFLRPSLDFSAMTFALFKLGVVPVFIDPGMGRENLLKCIKDCAPVALIAEKEVHFARLIFRKTFKSIKFNVTNGKRAWGKMQKISKMKEEKVQTFKMESFAPEDTAAILFTSGGTGAPKGVVYSHFIFDQQTSILKNLYGLTENDVDLPGFPLFSLFTIAMGMTSCIPDMDPSKPGQCNPAKLYQNIIDNKPTFVAGSPAIWERVADYCLDQGLTLPSIKYVVMFGAPVSVLIHRKFKGLLPNGTTYTPYGATEALPVSNISGDFILKQTAHLTENGKGTCIGEVAPGSEVKIIAITDQTIEKLSDAKILGANTVGEIIVSGPTVTKEYLDLPEKTREAKIYEGDKIWHRMGDMGFLDEKNQLWFLGRKAHRVETQEGLMTPIPAEAIFNKHPAVRRSALVGLGVRGKETPAIVIERKDGQFLSGKERSIFESELLSLAKKFPHTSMIQKIYLSKHFPVDVRHNIKIDRKKLKEEIESHEIN
ncbi:peptide synthase [Bacteriovorax stolpii]|uniref:Peptide synthase n=1 Tax=Bacteriovorax stolpii TaxID=960 RepID=A0A2K9NRH3_BACTC|nr:fatty acid CoA ligase family protein [Bacteriovorax stolpii]AUN98130.1 peptide synthase [Bacteriovorax stolpii]QDK41890.1 peptide synthase [Bacteriovorax stolpii]TDP52043.1 acyl-CoA synthetase (AMP-forming)/AMP-acid ligase II [Bacteriovorax stolpii]